MWLNCGARASWEDENQRLKRLVADLSLCAKTKVLKLARKREIVHFSLDAYRVSIRRACQPILMSCSVYNYLSCRNDRLLTMRIREIAETRIRYGCERINTCTAQA